MVPNKNMKMMDIDMRFWMMLHSMYNSTLTPECCRDLAEGRALLGRAMLCLCFIFGIIPNTEYRLFGADNELSW